MIRQVALMAFLACLSSAAGAQTSVLAPAAEALPDGSNYPEPHCKKPLVDMVKPPTDQTRRVDIRTQNDAEAMGRYNSKIKQFNRDNAAYNTCLHAYIDKANGDVKSIQDKANAELKLVTERANASMKMIQDKIRQAVADANSISAALDQETAKLRKQ